MNKTVFTVSKMDCPSEERIIRMKFDGDESVKQMEFDIPGRSLTVHHIGDVGPLFARLNDLNFGASIKSSEFQAAFEVPKVGDATKEGSVLKALFAINAVMFIIELGWGLWAESMGLISDSLDMLADASVYLISLWAVGKSVQAKKMSATTNGYLQIILGIGVILETFRRFAYGSEPHPTYMILVSFVALAANVYCLYLLSSHKDSGAHMKASYICSSTDVMANTGVIIAGALVFFTNSRYPDLVIGTIVSIIVLRGAKSILAVAR